MLTVGLITYLQSSRRSTFPCVCVSTTFKLTHKWLIATTTEICGTNFHLSKMTRSFFSILQCTEYGACVRALLIEKVEVKYEWVGERWGRIPFSAKQLLLSPLHIAYADTKVGLWSMAGERFELWYGVPWNWCFMPFDQRSSSYWPDGIISEDTALILLYPATWSFVHSYFMTCLFCQSLLLPIYKSEARNHTKFRLCVKCFLLRVKSYWYDLLI